jgi:hypothetical protein
VPVHWRLVAPDEHIAETKRNIRREQAGMMESVDMDASKASA